MKADIRRGEILTTIKDNEPINITALAKKLKLSGGTTIYRYLEELQERGLIAIYKEKKKRGQPQMVKTTSKAEPFKKELYEFLNKWGMYEKVRKD